MSALRVEPVEIIQEYRRNTVTIRKYIFPAILTLALAVWTGCDGGGGGGGDDGGVSGVTTVTDVSRGAIDGIASITMNGKTYEADDSTPVEGDDNPSFSDLQEGMVVMVEGGIDDDTGLLTAANISVEEAVKGPVTANNPLRVLHQTILITEQTIVDNNIPSQNPANLAVNDLVEVHGNVLAGGVIEGTFIEAKQPAELENWKVRGIIDSVGADSFTIGSLTVDTSAADLTDLSGGPQVGQFVEVKADPDSLSGTTLTANKVETDEIEVEDDIDLEVEGFVTSVSMVGASFAPGNSFTIGAQRVETSGGTMFLGGLPEDLVVGVKVEAEGESLNNLIQAEKVKFKESVRVEGNLVATANPSVFTIEGLSSIEVEINAFTEIEDGVAPSAGDHIRVRGRESASGSANRRVRASRIKVRNPDDDVELQAVVQPEDEPPDSESITILGVLIDTSEFVEAAGDDDSDFEGEDDSELTREQFFAAVQAGQTVVKAKGRLTDQGVIEWREVELEGEDD